MSAIFRIDLRNKRVFTDISNILGNTRRSIRQGFFKLGHDLKRTASKEILRKPKSGRTYFIRTRSGRLRRHVASAPGETHANITGAVRRSIGFQIHGSLSMDFGYGVKPNTRGPGRVALDRGEWLEFGTSGMKARPSLLNAINATTRNAENYFDNEFKKMVDR